MCCCWPEHRDLLAYDELRQYGLSNVFKTVEQSGFCSDTSSDSGVVNVSKQPSLFIDSSSDSEESTACECANI